MNTHVIELLEVTKKALIKTTYDLPITDEKSFYMLALENGLSAIAFAGINQNLITEELKKRLTKNFYDYVRRDARQGETIRIIKDLLNNHRIDFIMLKGSRLKPLYPESYMRGMGDIDVLIRHQDMKEVHTIFKSHQIKIRSRSKQHDVFETADGLPIEIHPMLYKNFNAKYQHLLSDPWAHAHVVDGHEYAFDHAYEALYLLYHLAKHMDSSGIGLRSVLDIGMYINHYAAAIDTDRLLDMLDQSGMRRFFDVMLKLNQTLFGFEFNMPIVSVDDSTIEALTEYLMISGIHGQGSNFNAFEARIASYEMKDKSRFKMIMDIAFPSYETMKSMYPFVEKGKILIIFGWMARWFKLFFRKTRSTIRKIRSLFVKKKAVDQHRTLFEDIGLK